MELPQPYYEEPGITIYHGDCYDILPRLPDISLLLTDPPYGINWPCDYRAQFKPSAKSNAKNSPRSMRVYPQVYGDDRPFDPTPFFQFEKAIIWGAPCFMNHLPNGSLLVWHKREGNFLAHAEAAWMNSGTGVYVFVESIQCLQPVRVHPMQKPVELMKWCIQRSKPEGMILDPFMGSGTTLRAAKDLGRQVIGIEIEENYCEIAVNRLRQEVLNFT